MRDRKLSRRIEFKLEKNFVVRRSGGASGTASAGMVPSTGGGPGNPTGGGRMAVIGVTRNVRLRRRGASGFGFSLRGGREYAAGFYVSDVQPGSEAHRNGLRVNSKFNVYTSYYIREFFKPKTVLSLSFRRTILLLVRWLFFLASRSAIRS